MVTVRVYHPNHYPCSYYRNLDISITLRFVKAILQPTPGEEADARKRRATFAGLDVQVPFRLNGDSTSPLSNARVEREADLFQYNRSLPSSRLAIHIFDPQRQREHPSLISSLRHPSRNASSMASKPHLPWMSVSPLATGVQQVGRSYTGPPSPHVACIV